MEEAHSHAYAGKSEFVTIACRKLGSAQLLPSLLRTAQPRIGSDRTVVGEESSRPSFEVLVAE